MQKIPIQKGSICYSFDNQSGKLEVLKIYKDKESGNMIARCKCLESHPHGYQKGYEGGWYVKYLRRLDETFICSSCETEWEIEFRYEKGVTFLQDDTGFDTDEATYYETCGNCHVSALSGINVSETKFIEGDLPF